MVSVRRVLLVEDDANDALLTMRFLLRWRHPLEVHVSTSLEDAAAYLQNEPSVALVILDHMMPGCSGMDLLTTLRSDGCTGMVPVVVMTGNSDGHVVQRAREAGANSCVLKPIDPEDYERTVLAIADFWLGTNLSVRYDSRASMR